MQISIKNKKIIFIIASIISSVLTLTVAQTQSWTSFSPDATYAVCFTPGQNCTGQIVSLINGATSEILVQGYSFTSAPIAKALVNAKKRGVSVRIILDKNEKSQQYSGLRYLLNQGMAVWIDYELAIAHNKVMIIDRQIVQTGSFNYTKAAQFRNAENVLIIRDKNLAQQYIANWDKRLRRSVVAKQYVNGGRNF